MVRARATSAVLCVLATAMAVVAAPSSSAATTHRPVFTVGTYPLGYAGGGSPDPAPDSKAKIVAALDRLQGDNRNGFVVRDYIGYSHTGSSSDQVLAARPYLGHGRRLDLVASYYAKAAPGAAWERFVRHVVRVGGSSLAYLSLGVDANVPQESGPYSARAVAEGVVAAKQEARRLGLHELRIGFDVVSYSTSTTFWKALAKAGGRRFAADDDYVGVEDYPDVFSVQPGNHGTQAVEAVSTVRHTEMPIAGLGRRVAIHVSENGWPSVGSRTEADQAKVVRGEILAIYHARRRLGITDYEYFDLRDDRTGSPNPIDNLGLLRDDYTPKPAFAVVRSLFARIR